MTSIRVFDQSLTQQAYIDDYASAYLEPRWNEIGTFEIKTNENALYADELQLDRIVMFSDDPYRSGIIEEVIREEGANGKGSQVVTARGRELKAIFERRFVQPPTGEPEYTDRQDAEGVMKDLVKSQMGSTAAASRQVSSLTISTDQARGSTFVLATRWKNLAATLENVSLSTGLGWFVYLDLTNKKFVFDVGVGADRRASQSVNGRAIFSSDYDTLETSALTKSNVKKKNLVYAAGRGVGEDRLITAVYDTTEPTGLDRREYFYDYRTIPTVTELEEVGANKLEEMSVDTYIDGSILTYSQYTYKTDYALGDLVTVETYGETINPRIVGVRESWAPASYRIDLAFDRNYPEFNRQVADNVSELNRILNQTEIDFTYLTRATTDGRDRITTDGYVRRLT